MTSKSKAQDKHKISEIDENISKLFDIRKRLGKGAYGIVWKALDRRTNETLAVKKIFDAFRDETDAQRTFREICFLQSFRCHPNIIKLQNVYKAVNNLDIYLVFEYMESDLHNIIKKGTILKDVHKRFVMYQLINAIRYIHSGNVIHRDLKPSNVLIDSKCRCKLADFGLARSVASRPSRERGDNCDMGSDPQTFQPLLTDYVATRWYRAPEILVASKRYTKGIDMWSLGCILAEMVKGKPLFQGSSTINQIEKIVSAMPDITEHDVSSVGAGFGSVLLNRQASTEKKTSLDELLFDASEDALHLIKSLLVLDPLGRLTASQAMEHPYIERFRHSVNEAELYNDVVPPFRDDVRLSVCEYRTKLYEIAHTLEQTKASEINGRRKQVHGERASTTKHRESKHHHERAERKSLKVRHQSSNGEVNPNMAPTNAQRLEYRYIEPEPQNQPQQLLKQGVYLQRTVEVATSSSSPTKRPLTTATTVNVRLTSESSKHMERRNLRSNFFEHTKKYQSPSAKNNPPLAPGTYSSTMINNTSSLNCITPTVQMIPKSMHKSPPQRNSSPPQHIATESLKLQRSSSSVLKKVDCLNGNGKATQPHNGVNQMHPMAMTEKLLNQQPHQQHQRAQHRSPPEKKLNRSYSLADSALRGENTKCLAQRLRAAEQDIEKFKKEMSYYCASSEDSNTSVPTSNGKHSEESSGDYYRSTKYQQINVKINGKSPSRRSGTIPVNRSYVANTNCNNNNNNGVAGYRSLPKTIKRERSRTNFDYYNSGGSGDHISYEFYLHQNKDLKFSSSSTSSTSQQHLRSQGGGEKSPTTTMTTTTKNLRSRLLPKVI